MKYRSFTRLTALLLLFVSGVLGGIANAQPAYVEDLSAIERDLGPHSTYADVEAAVGNGRAATALRVTVGRVGDWTYRGPWTPTSANERLAIFSDDGCTITIQPLAGGPSQTLINRAGMGQNLFNTALSLAPLNFTPVAGTTYTVEVRYSNVVHENAADIDGLTLFHYREVAPTSVVYDPQLASNQITPYSARLFWQPYPVAADFISLTLLRDTQNPVRMDAERRVATITDVGVVERIDNAPPLLPDTTYFYKLRLRYREGGVEKTKDFPPHELRTAKEGWRLTLTGTRRACAGHVVDETHIASLTATVQRRNAAGVWEDMPATEVRLSLENAGDQGAPAQLLHRATPTDAEQLVPPGTTVTVTSDDKDATLAIRVLSGQQVSTNVQIKAEVQTVADGVTTWQSIEVPDGQLDFGASESKRLFGIVNDWNETYANDMGWEFESAIFDGPNQILVCHLYLNFRRDTNDALVNRNYFKRGAAEVLTLDTIQADGQLSAQEQASGVALGTRLIPLRNGANGQPLWLPVNGHTVQIRIEDFSIPNDDNTAPVVGYDARAATFCDSAGNPVRPNAAGTGIEPIPAGQPVVIPSYIPIPVVDGVATFYLRSGTLIQQATRIELSAKDVTQIRN